MPRLRPAPSFEDQLRVRDLAAIGLSEEDIATQLRLPLPRLHKVFKQELKEGAATGREHAVKKLHTAAMSGDNHPALTFWIKSKCGWRDTGVPQNATSLIRRVLVINHSPQQNGPAPAERNDHRST
jgi:hypothetical protein